MFFVLRDNIINVIINKRSNTEVFWAFRMDWQCKNLSIKSHEMKEVIDLQQRTTSQI